jgi:NADH dehydrogenase
MALRIFVTGASGFVGSAIVSELVSRKMDVRALVNRKSVAEEGAVTPVRASLFDVAALEAGMEKCDAVIHLVGIIMEKQSRGVTFQRMHVDATRNVVEAAKRAHVRRFIHMSALGSRPDAASTYHKTKFAAEEIVRASGLEWTIFRPSLIHGPRGEFMRMEARWARHTAPPFLFMPYFGAGVLGFGGAGMLQPIYVGDVARAFVAALENRKTIGEVYPLGGPDEVTWPQLHKTVSQEVVGKKRMTVAMPVWKAKLLAAVGVGKLAGFNRDQVIMSQEQNTCDITKFVDDFGFTPAGFEPSLREYAAQLK